VVLAFPILLEAYTLILYRLGFRTAATWLEDVHSGCAWINPSAQDYREATALVVRFSDQSISLFDATLAILASRLNLPVWTYDHHFDAMQALSPEACMSPEACTENGGPSCPHGKRPQIGASLTQ
jgi:predicted nucleic acid-binding protein